MSLVVELSAVCAEAESWQNEGTTVESCAGVLTDESVESTIAAKWDDDEDWDDEDDWDDDVDDEGEDDDDEEDEDDDDDDEDDDDPEDW